MHAKRSLPDPDKLSLFTAATTLVIVLGRWSDFQGPTWTYAWGPHSWQVHLSPRSVLIVILTALSLSGMDWLLRDHPLYEEQRNRVLWHALLPTFALDALATLIRTLPLGPAWIFVLLVGLVSVVALVVAEYIVLDPQDPRALWATWALQATGYGLFFLFALGLYQSAWAPSTVAVLLAMAAWFIGRRLWALQAPQATLGPESLALALLAVHWGWSLAFLCQAGLTPAAAGLLLLAGVYGWTQVVIARLQGLGVREALRMSLVPSFAFVLLALMFWTEVPT
ncbi:MAG: hypothetical protein GXO36_02005 [Chloroflexi bacterium]|nr:hypothetical protein [Chloroflexota bacterium]